MSQISSKYHAILCTWRGAQPDSSMESVITQNENLKILMIGSRLVTSNELSGAQMAVLTHTVGKSRKGGPKAVSTAI